LILGEEGAVFWEESLNFAKSEPCEDSLEASCFELLGDGVGLGAFPLYP
jgi:hypothetical protein